jgi:hypothetical protein
MYELLATVCELTHILSVRHTQAEKAHYALSCGRESVPYQYVRVLRFSSVTLPSSLFLTAAALFHHGDDVVSPASANSKSTVEYELDGGQQADNVGADQGSVKHCL